jgi:Flp pilus assembly protein TadB
MKLLKKVKEKLISMDKITALMLVSSLPLGVIAGVLLAYGMPLMATYLFIVGILNFCGFLLRRNNK